jgi:cytochrome c oxidase assembly protein subunit 20
MSYAVGSFVLSSAGAFEFCQRRRALERAGMQRATEIIQRKKEEREREAHRVREESRRQKEAAERRRVEEARGAWGWRFWQGRGDQGGKS